MEKEKIKHTTMRIRLDIYEELKKLQLIYSHLHNKKLNMTEVIEIILKQKQK